MSTASNAPDAGACLSPDHVVPGNAEVDNAQVFTAAQHKAAVEAQALSLAAARFPQMMLQQLFASQDGNAPQSLRTLQAGLQASWAQFDADRTAEEERKKNVPDKVFALQTQAAALQTQVTALQTQLVALQGERKELLAIVYDITGVLPCTRDSGECRSRVKALAKADKSGGAAK
jgi:hypothetical protein